MSIKNKEINYKDKNLQEDVETEEYLWKTYKETNDPAIRNKIILKYTYLVKCISLQLRGIYKQFADVDDIINEGVITLIDAINKYDLDKSTKFSTYATIRIRGSIIDYVRKQDWVPRRVKKFSKDIDQVETRLRLDLNRDPTTKEIATDLNLTEKEYTKKLSETNSVNILSFEQILTDKLSDGIEIKSNIAQSDDMPEARMDDQELRNILAESIDKLTERERIIVSLYYYEELKLKEISKVLEVSESRICQIHANIVKKLRKSLTNYVTM